MKRWDRLRLLAAAARAERSARALEWGDTGALARHREEAFRLAARRAAEVSPVYRDLYRGIDLDDPALASHAVPPISKDVLMERFDDWVAPSGLRRDEVEAHVAGLRDDDALLGEGYRVMATGGTTGARGLFLLDPAEWAQCLAAFMRWSRMYGLAPKLPRRRIATVGAVHPLHMTTRFAMSIDAGLHRTLRLDARTPVDEQRALLRRFRPDALVGYPSALALLAEEQLAGRLEIAPRTVATTSEVRTADMADRIRRAWGVAPFDTFGATEAIYAGECDHHVGMHVFEDLGMVEVVDDRGRPVPDGQRGTRLLVTSFVKRSQPVVRYEISDIAAVTRERCPCGRAFARFVAIEGRSDDVLRLPGLTQPEVAVHPIALRSPLAALGGLRQYRIVCHDDAIVVQVVPRDASDGGRLVEDVRTGLTRALREAGAVPPRIDVELTDVLAREANHAGKFKLVERRPGSRRSVPTA